MKVHQQYIRLAVTAWVTVRYVSKYNFCSRGSKGSHNDSGCYGRER